VERQYQDLRWRYYLEEIDFREEPHSRVFLTRDGPELSYEIFDYFPHHHFQRALESYERVLDGPSLEDVAEGALTDRLRSDGGDHDVYLWYNPETNAVVQEEVSPGLWTGLFDQREEAVAFLETYREENDLDEVSHLSLYGAEIDEINGAEDMIQ
jgi:hypothetical protein